MNAAIPRFFPYPEIRPAQAAMMETVKKSVDEGKHIALEGSTGMGKTIAVLCGALSSPEAENRRIVYCCRTHKQMDRVIEELRAINQKQKISGVSLRGRREMCINPLVRRFTVSASEAAHTCGVLRRVGKCEFHENMRKREERVAELEELFSQQPVPADEFIELCRGEKFCPYELANKVLSKVKVVVASYVYLLDPTIRPLFLRHMHAELADLIVVLDEAHNLPDVALELASDTLSTSSISAAIHEAEEFKDKHSREVASEIHELVEGLAAELVGDAPEGEEILDPLELLNKIKRATKRRRFRRLIGRPSEPRELFEALQKVGEEHAIHKLRQGETPRSYLQKIGSFFLKLIETAGQSHYVHIISRNQTRRGKPITKLEIQALDPRVMFKPVIDSVHSSVSMSGTLAPIKAYRDVIGLPQDTIIGRHSSPFPKENVLALVVKGVTTKETRRTSEMFEKLAGLTAEVVAATPANVGVFTASYGVLERLLEAGLAERIQKPLFSEGRKMSSSENDRLIKKFKAKADAGGAVLLGVQGGRNSEGGDFPGNQMNAVVVVGIPYARPTKHTQASIEYYESQFSGRGKFYGYYLPAHRRMCQAAGRAHRLTSDKAAVVFLDSRVATAFVRSSLPMWLRGRLEVIPDAKGALSQRLQAFFDERQQSIEK